MAAKFQYSRMARTAKRLIDRFGGPAALKAYYDTPNPDQPNRPGTRVSVEQNLQAVFLKYEEKHIDGTQVKMGDQRVLIEAMSLVLPVQLKGQIVRQLDGESEVWNIVTIKPLNPGGVRLIYTIQVRR